MASWTLDAADMHTVSNPRLKHAVKVGAGQAQAQALTVNPKVLGENMGHDMKGTRMYVPACRKTICVI